MIALKINLCSKLQVFTIRETFGSMNMNSKAVQIPKEYRHIHHLGNEHLNILEIPQLTQSTQRPILI